MRIIIENETAGGIFLQDLTQKGSLTYPISMDELAALLPGAIRKESAWKTLSFGAIPLNCIWHSIRFNKTQQTHDAVFFVPAGKRQFLFNSVDYLVPIPNLIFKFSVCNERCNAPMVAVVKESDMPTQSLYGIRSFVPKDTAKLFRWPFSNVSSSGAICMGGKDYGRISCLDDLVNVPEIFMSSIMTDHHYTGANNTRLNYSMYLDSLNGMDTFPEEHLVPMKVDYATWRK